MEYDLTKDKGFYPASCEDGVYPSPSDWLLATDAVINNILGADCLDDIRFNAARDVTMETENLLLLPTPKEI